MGYSLRGRQGSDVTERLTLSQYLEKYSRTAQQVASRGWQVCLHL